MGPAATCLRMCWLEVTVCGHGTMASLMPVAAGIVLEARQDSRYALTMTIAATVSTVEVTSTATQINTENGVLADSKGGTLIGELPLNFRASTTSPLAALTTSANVQTDNQGNVAVGGATATMVRY